MEKSTACFPQWSPMDWIREMFHGYVRLLEGTWYRCAAPYAIFEVHFSRTAYAEDLLAYCKAGYLHLEVIKKEEKPSKKRIPLDSLHRKHWRFPCFFGEHMPTCQRNILKKCFFENSTRYYFVCFIIFFASVVKAMAFMMGFYLGETMLCCGVWVTDLFSW